MKEKSVKDANIVIINDMLYGGGRERRIVQLISGLNKLGINNITLILLDERVDYPEIFDLDVNVIRLVRRNNRDLSVFPKIYNILKDVGPCIVNPWSYMTIFYAAPICLVLRFPCLGAFVVDAKRPKTFSLNWLCMRLGFFSCRKIIGNSQAGHDAYGTPKPKQLVIYNGFNAARLMTLPSAQVSTRQIQIAMIGRLDKQKDYHTFIDACSLLEDRRIDFQAFVVGQGEDWEKLQVYASMRCGNKITFTGFMKNIDQFIAGIDIGALCTDPVFHAEGISNALMEIMAQGKPVVATNDGGTPEIILDGHNGYLVPPRDAKALADKLQLLCRNPDLRKSMGSNAAETISTKFSLPRMALEFCEAYNGCL